ncbi:hypothetical protein CSV79_02460 [Sporosarcina sp. P13]|nr:hypothetical protein CSV79_02460 [Sporosarcina sp. P13]
MLLLKDMDIAETFAVSGFTARVPPERITALHESYTEDRIRRMKGHEPSVGKVLSFNSEGRPVYNLDEAVT